MVSNEIAEGYLYICIPEGALEGKETDGETREGLPFLDHYPKHHPEAKVIKRFRGTSNTFKVRKTRNVNPQREVHTVILFHFEYLCCITLSVEPFIKR